MLLRQPAQDLASSNSHALTGRSNQALVEVTNQNFFHYVPGVIGAEQTFDIVGVENFERLLEQLHYFHAQHVQMAERQPLEIVAQVEAAAPHDAVGADARIVSALPSHT